MSRDSYRAAQLLHANERYRSAISRAYYCGYSALVAVLSDVKGIRFGHGGSNPTHEKLAALVKNLDEKVYNKKLKKWLIQAIRRLRASRVLSDYGANSAIDYDESRRGVKDATFIVTALGVVGESK